MKARRELAGTRSKSHKQILSEDAKPFKQHTQDFARKSAERLPNLQSPKNNLFSAKQLQKDTEEVKTNDLSPLLLRKPPRKSSINTLNVVTRVGFKSRVGYVKGKPKLHNQDSFIIKSGLQGMRGHYLFGVCDGHGSYGHLVSQYIRDAFPGILEESLEKELSFLSIEKNFYKAVSKLCKGLQETGIEIAFSGSTLVFVLIIGSNCVCGNVGDSRVVLGKCFNDIWEGIPLSHDHNTKRIDERTRILNSHGRISQAQDFDGNFEGPERVWLLDDDIPGLAMTRSIGDKISKAVGVTSDPEVIARKLCKDDKFLIIASDGVWEYISNENAVDIVRNYWEQNSIEEATQALVSEASKKWKKEEYTDDITVVIIFLSVPD